MKKPSVMLYLLLAVTVLLTGTSLMLSVIHSLLAIGAFLLGTVIGSGTTLYAINRSIRRQVNGPIRHRLP